jgi:hypothetical protein
MKPRVLLALIVLGSWFVPVAGRTAGTTAGVIRTMTGVRYVVPAGWEWTDFDGVGQTLQHVATKGIQKGKEQSPNQFSLAAHEVTDEALGQGWNRLDRDERRTFEGGSTAAWKAGPRSDGAHYAFEGVIRVGSRVLSVSILDAPTPKFDEHIVETAFLEIAESAHEVPESRTIYHPTLALSTVMLDAGTWSASVSAGSISYGCVASACGKGSDARMFVYPSKVEFPSAAAELADVTGYFKTAAHLKIGPTQRQEIAGGEVVWTEQPGSIRPLLGAVRSDGHSYFIAMSVNGKTTRAHDALRADFLAVAKSVHAWDGQ